MDYNLLEEDDELEAGLEPVDSIAGPQTPRDQVMQRISQVRSGSGDEGGAPFDADLEFAKQSAMSAGIGRGLNALAAGTGARVDNSGYDAMEKRGTDALNRGAAVRKAIETRKAQDSRTKAAMALRDRQMGETERHNRAMELAAGGAEGKRLPPDKVLLVNEGNSIPKMLQDIRLTLDKNSDIFGPVAGRVAAINPYNERAQTADAQMRSAAQTFGRYMEGGVLRKEDEEKYRKMFPSSSDTPEVAKNKLTIVERLLGEKQKSNLEALAASGYDTSGLRSDVQIPDLPPVLANGPKRNASGGLITDAQASGTGRVKVTNGSETYFIELRDLPDAMKDGFQVAK